MDTHKLQENRQFWRPPATLTTSHNPKPAQGVEKRLCEFVLANSQQDNPASVISAIDQFCLQEWMMNVGPEKGAILQHIMGKYKVKRVLEVGGYCGYSSLLFANHVKDTEGGRVLSLQINEGFAAIAHKLQIHAGLSSIIKIHKAGVQDSLAVIKEEGPFDLIFLDHLKEMYLPDFNILEAAGLMKADTVVVADNIIFPGAPQFLAAMKIRPDYINTLYHSYDAYSDTPDAVLESRKTQ